MRQPLRQPVPDQPTQGQTECQPLPQAMLAALPAAPEAQRQALPQGLRDGSPSLAAALHQEAASKPQALPKAGQRQTDLMPLALPQVEATCEGDQAPLPDGLRPAQQAASRRLPDAQPTPSQAMPASSSSPPPSLRQTLPLHPQPQEPVMMPSQTTTQTTTAPQTRSWRQLQHSAFVGLAALLLWAACGPSPTPCQTDAQCLNGFYCAQTNANTRVCVQRPTGSDATGTDQTASPADKAPPSDNGGPPPDRSGPPPDRSGPSDDTSPPPDRGSPPDDAPPVGCIPPPYNPANDPGNGGQTVQLDELDKAFFKTLRLIYHASQQCKDSVWGGKYEMHKIPTYVVNIGNGVAGEGKGVRGFLINHPSPPASATKIDSKLVFGIPNVYLYNDAKGKITQPGFSFDMDIGGVKSYAFEYGSSDDFINPTKGRECFAFFVHEGFHRSQDFEEAWQYAPGDQDTSRYPLDATTLALALLEGRILVDGFKGADPATQLQLFLAVQTERFKVDTSGVLKAHDAFQEWLEGTAQYTEHHYVKVIGTPYPDDDINSIPSRMQYLEYLTSDPQYTPTKDDLLNGFTARFYATGAAVGILLDRLGDKGWKDKIRSGNHFHMILQQKYPSINVAQLLQQAKTKYNFAELQKLGEAYAKLK